MSDVLYRDLQPSDTNFILSSWLKSYRPHARKVSDEVYFSAYKAHVLSLIERCDVHVACDPDYPLSVYGYLVSESQTVHYCYVKHALRRFGIATSLLERAGVHPSFHATHLTDAASKALAMNPTSFVYNPWRPV